MKMRYAEEAVHELRQMDPKCPISARTIRALANQGIIPSVPVGTGERRLINFDVLLDYLANPDRYAVKTSKVAGVRRLDE